MKFTIAQISAAVAVHRKLSETGLQPENVMNKALQAALATPPGDPVYLDAHGDLTPAPKGNAAADLIGCFTKGRRL